MERYLRASFTRELIEKESERKIVVVLANKDRG
jgi:hypothetical protein